MEILVCPWCLGALDFGDDRLTCRRCGAAYAVVEGIPNMHVEEAELHCPRCGAAMKAAEGVAACGPCGRRWSIKERLADWD